MFIQRENILNTTKEEIENYLTDIKNAIQNNQYRIERNSRRQDNLNLFVDYVIDEEKAKEILLDLAVDDFSAILKNG